MCLQPLQYRQENTYKNIKQQERTNWLVTGLLSTFILSHTRLVCWLASCLPSQQNANAMDENAICCHTETEVADQICYLTLPQNKPNKPVPPLTTKHKTSGRKTTKLPVFFCHGTTQLCSEHQPPPFQKDILTTRPPSQSFGKPNCSRTTEDFSKLLPANKASRPWNSWLDLPS